MNALDKFNHICTTMPLIAILRGITADEIIDIAGALIKAGIRIIEVPLNSPDPLHSIHRLCKEYHNEAICGAGTVLNVESVQAVLDTGAELIVAPNTNLNVINASLQANVVVLPGCSTATEMFNAIDAGANNIKFFPAVDHSDKALSAIKSILPDQISLFPVGGITLDNMQCFIKAGANGFGIGSSLYKPGMLADEVENRAIAFVQRIKELLN